MKKINLLAIILFALPIWTNAQTYVNQAANGTNDGSSWTNAYTSLQDAVQNAAIGEEIWIAAGTYYPSATADPTVSFEITNSIALHGGFAGTENNLEDRDMENNVTVLSGDYNNDDVVTVNSDPLSLTFSNTAENANRIINGANAQGTVELSGLTIKGGHDPNTGSGATLLSEDGNLTVIIQDCKFRDNIADGDAGALRMGAREGDTLMVAITNTSFIHSRSPGKGGAIWVTGPGVMITDYTNCTFQQNHSGQRGGAVVNDSEIYASYTNCIFAENRSTNGGATCENAIDDANYYNCVFYKNSASQLGSAIRTFSANKFMNLYNTIFYDNDSSPLYGSPLSVSNCILEAQDFAEILNIAPNSVDLGGILYTTDPEFVDASLFDFNLSSNSPIINAGNNSLINFDRDMDMIDRIVDGTVDMGAYEFHTPINAVITNEFASCFGTGTGSVEVDVNNYPPFEYHWSNGNATGMGLDNLSAGSYELTTTNDIGDQIVLNFTITELPEITATMSSTQATGNNTDGTATVVAAGGVAPFSYTWNTTPAQSTATATGLAAGEYTVTVVDGNGCELTASVLVDQTSNVVSVDDVVGIDVGPNPFNNQIQIKVSSAFQQSEELEQMYLYNATGQLMIQQTLTTGSTHLNVANLPKGVYILKLRGAVKEFHKRLVKQ